MLSKTKLINFLFVISFPFFGLGNYVSYNITPTGGYLVSAFPLLLIIVFYLLDSLYKRRFQIKVNRKFWWVVIFAGTVVYARFVAMQQGVPDVTVFNSALMLLLILAPVFGFIIVQLYNVDNEDFNFAKLTLISMCVLLFMNLAGFVAGMESTAHSFEGRMTYPFTSGIYTAGNTIAIINLMLLPYFKRVLKYPVYFLLLLIFFSFNLFLLNDANSRLTNLLFMLVTILYVTGFVNNYKLIFVSAWAMIPMLLSFAFLVYEIVSLPIFAAIMQRVDIEDVMTFNGRSYIWQAGLDWLLHDQRGLILGNGHKGYGGLDLFELVIRKWNILEEAKYDLHPHSTTLYIVICQGIVGLTAFMGMIYSALSYYRERYRKKATDSIFYLVVIFLIYLLQVDSYASPDDMGFMILTLLVSRSLIRKDLLAN